MKVFLGGTVDSKWRSDLEPLLEIDYFNPIVEEWTDESFDNEVREKNETDVHLYHITPKMTGAYSIAELVYDSFDENIITIFSFQSEEDDEFFDELQLKSLDKTGELMEKNGGIFLGDTTMDQLADFINELPKL